MKTKLLLIVLLGCNLTFAQNQSFQPVQNSITTPIGPQFTTEIFRFRPGLVTQLDLGSTFDFTNSRWFALGRVAFGTQNFYGLRFQLPNKSIVMGYNDLNAINPRIEWIGNPLASTLGNLEFRVGSGFGGGSPSVPGPNLLVATMTSAGNTVFGNPSLTGSAAKVSIDNSGTTGLVIRSSNSATANSQAISIEQFSATNDNVGAQILLGGASSNTGIVIKNGPGKFNTGVLATSFADINAIGIQGRTTGQAQFEAAIFGQTSQNNGNQFAGFFDGDVVITGNFPNPSDIKLKENVKPETNVLERLSKLKSVTYNYKTINELNLAKGVQHGFIAQEMAVVFPELTKDISKPVFDKDGKATSNFEFKSINYTGLISILTAAVNEMHTEVKALKEELTDLKTSIASGDFARPSATSGNKVILEQNIPNPFSDRTTIKYQLPQGTSKASLIVFDLNGGIKKEFPLTENKSEITVSASQIGKGLFIYSLVQNGQILETRKMIIQ
jgi:hypothetical protein